VPEFGQIAIYRNVQSTMSVYDDEPTISMYDDEVNSWGESEPVVQAQHDFANRRSEGGQGYATPDREERHPQKYKLGCKGR
jgi:hypothetical protein